MIRFIDLTGQIYLDEEEVSFAFYDTVRNRFCEFSDTQCWDNIEEFINDYTGDDIERFLRLIPKNIVYQWKDVMVQINGKTIDITPIEYEKDK
ncbi:hypothetical protein DBR39_13840 [Chryseobacterium sp. KBW03]|uniref:hypothetical protein n=1 Tax=Chryseobacterium sp. KBW03 TaxID=2153362 RepID=UPI000F5A786C|nr:hypothetical protein [Chryseobacterium sp. KBW03]RQO37964.1 hypothetical protein DBR39_13840 [Chryseobacterium sp. KBW03]